MSQMLGGAAGLSLKAVVISVVAGTALAGVAGVSLTAVAKSATSGASSSNLKDINAPRYADQ